MNINIANNNIQPGDRIVVPKSSLNIVQHHAIYLGQDNQGTDLVAENVVGVGVRLVTADDFFSDVTLITRIERFSGDNYQRRLAVERALKQVDRPYDLINYNCESFSNHVQYDKPESKQVTTGFAFAGLLALMIGLSFVE